MKKKQEVSTTGGSEVDDVAEVGVVGGESTIIDSEE
jgi:hypothetical protein